MAEPEAGRQRKHRILDRPLDRGRLTVDFEPAEYGMAPLALEVLVPGHPSPADLHLPLYDRDQRRVVMELAAEQGEEFKALWRDRLLAAEQRLVYVKLDQVDQLQDYFQRFAPLIMEDASRPLRHKARVVQELALFNLNTFFNAADTSPRAIKNLVGRVQQTVTRLTADTQVLSRLSGLLRTDYSVYTHSVNVAMLTMALARYLGFNEPSVHAYGVGAMMHDVGRIKLPPALVNKTGPLSDNEMAQVRQHPYLGYQMLLQIGAVPYDALMIVLHHHENADGSGYPHGLTAERTPMPARLVRLADAFDAMTSERPHQDAKSAYEAAATMLQESEATFGKDLVPSFIRFLGSPFVVA